MSGKDSQKLQHSLLKPPSEQGVVQSSQKRRQTLYWTRYSGMNQVKFVETAFKKFEGAWSASSRPYHFKYFKGCLPQILFGPFLNTLSHINMSTFLTVFPISNL